MKKLLPILLSLVMCGCATNATNNTQSAGRISFAGPSSADGDVLSIKWLYMINFTIPKETISEVSFSCEGIPATAVTVQAKNIKYIDTNLAVVEAPPIAVSKETTAWLYSPGTTSSTCQAVVSRINQPQLISSVPVTFTEASKVQSLAQLKMAFEHNKSLKQK